MDFGVIDHLQLQDYLYDGTVYTKSKQYVIVEEKSPRTEINNPFEAAGIEIAESGITIKVPEIIDQTRPEGEVIVIDEPDIDSGSLTERATDTVDIQAENDKTAPEVVTSKIKPKNEDSLILSMLEGTPYVVHFGSNIHELIGDKTGALNNLVKRLKDHLHESLELYQFNITGYTDPEDTAEYNLELGRKRAESVATILAAAGLKTEIISKGECCQLRTHELSRRVEIEIKNLK